jgi:hypothetical protein
MKSTLLNDVDSALNSGSVGEFFMGEDSRLAKAIIDSYMRNRPYAPLFSGKKRIR